MRPSKTNHTPLHINTRRSTLCISRGGRWVTDHSKAQSKARLLCHNAIMLPADAVTLRSKTPPTLQGRIEEIYSDTDASMESETSGTDSGEKRFLDTTADSYASTQTDSPSLEQQVTDTARHILSPFVGRFSPNPVQRLAVTALKEEPYTANSPIGQIRQQVSEQFSEEVKMGLTTINQATANLSPNTQALIQRLLPTIIQTVTSQEASDSTPPETQDIHQVLTRIANALLETPTALPPKSSSLNTTTIETPITLPSKSSSPNTTTEKQPQPYPLNLLVQAQLQNHPQLYLRERRKLSHKLQTQR